MPRRNLCLAITLLMLAAGCSPVRRSFNTLARNDLVFIDEEADRAQFGRRMRIVLNGRRYDRLDEIADSLERTDPRWPSGRKVLDSFYDQGFGKVGDGDNPEQWQVHLDRLREWREARRHSDVARFALAEALIGRAWAARGGGWASSVSKGQWQRFRNDLQEAGQLLKQLPDRARGTYEWHSAMMKVLHGAGNDSAYRLVASSALQKFPDEPRFYTGIANHLMPRWYGEVGDWELFADRETADLPDSISDEFYARIVTDQSTSTRSVFRESQGLSWERAKRGLQAWRRRCPVSTQPLSASARLAWMASDRTFARESFASLRDTFDVEVWNTLPPYWTAREWALQGGP